MNQSPTCTIEIPPEQQKRIDSYQRTVDRLLEELRAEIGEVEDRIAERRDWIDSGNVWPHVREQVSRELAAYEGLRAELKHKVRNLTEECEA